MFKIACADCLYDTLLIIINRAMINSPDQDTSKNHQSFETFTNGIVAAAFYGLGPYIHETLLKHQLFNGKVAITSITSLNDRINKLNGSIRISAEFLSNKEISCFDAMEFVLLQFIAACYTLIYHIKYDLPLDAGKYLVEDYEKLLDQVYNQFNSHLYFKYLLILKSIKEQPIEMQNLLHNDLMKRLATKDGFSILCHNLLPIKGTTNDQPIWKRAEIIYNIVGHRGHSNKFTSTIIEEIFKFYLNCFAANNNDYRLACVGSLSKIYAKPSIQHRQQIESHFVGHFDKLSAPTDLLTGCILYDDNDLRCLINVNSIAFCAPTAIRLPTKILVNYLPILFNLHNQLQDESMVQNQVTSLIVQCLSNRNSDQLKQLVDIIISEDYPPDMKIMHSRVCVKFDSRTKLYTVQVASVDANNIEYDAATIFLKILKQSQHNLFIYNVFLHLLYGFKDCFGTIDAGRTTANSELLDNFSELEIGLKHNFKRKLTTIYMLSELINYKPFHSQFNENPQEIHSVLKLILQQKIDNLKLSKDLKSKENDPVLIIILLIIREFLPKLKSNAFNELVQILRELKTFYSSDSASEIRQEINSILEIIDETQTNCSNKHSKTSYELARQLCEEAQPHLIVYGLTNFVKLIAIDKDPETLTNKHIVLAIALNSLKNEESYVFMNCIKLLIVLMNVLEVDVIDCMVAEFQTEGNSIDFRLKIGEVIVKVTEGLGEFFF